MRSGAPIFLVKAVLANKGGDSGVEDSGRAGSVTQGGARAAGGGGFIEVGKQIEPGLAARTTAQAESERVGRRGIAGRDRDGAGQSGGEAAQIEAGTGGNDEIAGHQKVGGAIPFADRQKRVGAHQEEDSVVIGEGSAQGTQRVDGVVGAAIGAGRVNEGELEARLALDGEAGHGHAVGEAGLGAVALERLDADRREEDAVQGQALHSQARQGDVPAMRRVETAAKEADLHYF